MGIPLEEWRKSARKFRFADHDIACWLGGNPEGRPLLLIHGFPTASWDWAAVWDRLGETRALVAADMLGFGLSDKPGKRYSMMEQADLQLALMDHLGLEEYDVLAHDYGVSVAQEMLARQGEGQGAAGLGQIIFLNGGIFPRHHRPMAIQKIGASAAGPMVSAMMNRKRFGKSFAQVFGPRTQPSEEELDDYWQLIAHKRGHRITHRLLRYMQERLDNEERWVGAIKGAPDRIGFINGALDPVSGRHVYEKWRATLPGARAHLLSDIGHYPQVEAPKAVARQVLEWIG